MYNEIIEKITRKIKKCVNYVSSTDIDFVYIGLLYLKYLCVHHKYKYEDIIKNENFEKYIDEFEPIVGQIYKKFQNSSINKLLSMLEFEDLKELIKEFINNHNTNNIDLIDKDSKIIYVTNLYTFNLYNVNGNSIYVNYNPENINFRRKELFKLLDKMLNIHNTYNSEIESSYIDDKTIIYMYDDFLSYRYLTNHEILKYVFMLSHKYKNTKIILETKYRKIANMKEKGYYENLRRVIMLKDIETVYLFYNYETSKQISIIMYNQDKYKIDELKKIISKDRKQKDVLIKVSKEEIYNNNGKIGFRIYQNKNDETRNINDIVEENSRLTERLIRINEQIKLEIDSLINK